VTPTDDDHSVLYEVNMEADAAVAGAFDTWLRDHIADLLQFDGFLSAEILEDRDAPPGRLRRIVQYRLRNQSALDDYVRDHAPRTRAQGVARFGDRFSTERRVLAHRERFVRGAVSTANCLNCGEVLTGQHCSRCGQRARVRVLSLWGLLKDMLGDALDWDSRLWRTLRPLAFKPGLLTQEFLRGKRASYTPPFRMYLILSVVFFLITTIGADPGANLELNVGDNGANLRVRDPAAAPQSANPPAPAAAPAPASGAERQKAVDSIVEKLPGTERARARMELQREFATLKPDDIATVRKVMEDPCNTENLKIGIGPLGDQYAPRLRKACRRIVTDSRGYGRALYDNIPKMMFIFLPLVAGVMYVLYLGSGRYYVEHLLFFVHFHAYFFLGGTVIALLDRGGSLLQSGAAADSLVAADGVVAAAFAIYTPYYLYRAMRRVYGQGRVVTLVKYSLLGIGYLFFMTVTAVGLLFYTALTL